MEEYIIINGFKIIPNKTIFSCTIRPPFNDIILIKDAILKYDKDILAYIIESNELNKIWIYATLVPYFCILDMKE